MLFCLFSWILKGNVFFPINYTYTLSSSGLCYILRKELFLNISEHLLLWVVYYSMSCWVHNFTLLHLMILLSCHFVNIFYFCRFLYVSQPSGMIVNVFERQTDGTLNLVQVNCTRITIFFITNHQCPISKKVDTDDLLWKIL